MFVFYSNNRILKKTQYFKTEKKYGSAERAGKQEQETNVTKNKY